MKLTGDRVLEGVIAALAEQVALHVDDAFAAEALRMAGSLVAIVGRAGDDAAAIRVAENAAMRALFARAGDVVSEPGLAARLAEAAGSTDPGLRISELDGETGRLRALLIELHAWLETRSSPEARALDDVIWRAMREWEMARAPRG